MDDGIFKLMSAVVVQTAGANHKYLATAPERKMDESELLPLHRILGRTFY